MTRLWIVHAGIACGGTYLLMSSGIIPSPGELWGSPVNATARIVLVGVFWGLVILAVTGIVRLCRRPETDSDTAT